MIAFKKVGYRTLGKIYSAYQCGSHEKLGKIIVIESLEIKLDNISISWADRALRSGDKHIQNCLE